MGSLSAGEVRPNGVPHGYTAVRCVLGFLPCSIKVQPLTERWGPPTSDLHSTSHGRFGVWTFRSCLRSTFVVYS
jgi:hypothetical protein